MQGKADASTIAIGTATTLVLTADKLEYWMMVASLCVGVLTAILLVLRVARILAHWKKWWSDGMEKKD